LRSTVERLAFGREPREQRRRLPEFRVARIGRGEALHAADHPVQPDGVRVEHRPAAIQREPVAREIHHVDVRRAQRDAFFEYARALIDQRVDAALDDFLVADLARRHALLLAEVDDQLLDRRIGNRVALAGLVAIPAAAGFLPEAAELAQAIGNAGVNHFGMFLVTALADVPADVVAGEIAHAKRSHRHAPLLERAIDLRRGRALFEQEQRLARVMLDHAIADETVAHAGHDRGLFDRLRELHYGRQHVLAGLRAAHDFEQLHHVRGTEEMRADHVLGALGEGRDLIDVERGSVGREDRARLRDFIELLEDALLDADVFEYRLDDEVGVFDVAVGQGRLEQAQALLELLGGQLAFLHRVFVVLADGRHAPVERVLLHLEDRHGNAGVQKVHSNAAAHGTGADNGDFLDFTRRRAFRDVGNFLGSALA